MPVLRQPASLEELSTRRACEDLDGVCRRLQALSLLGTSGQHVLEYAKRKLRPYYVNSLPGTIRSRMIDETSKSLYGGGGNGSALFAGPTPLYLLTILLGPDVKRLKINLCCYYGCSHQTDLLKLLSKEGVGIESLELARSALLRLDCQLMRTALQKMGNLRSLTMRNIASDSILEVIGRSCPKLIVLDVACSQQVTDLGLRQLLMKLRVRVQRDQIKMANRRETPEDTRDVSRHRRRRSTTWSRIKTLLGRLKVKAEKNGRKEEDFLLDITETPNLICQSLRVLNVAKTSVTNAGLSIVLARATKLESLGDYNSVGRAIEMKNRAGIRDLGGPFNLKEARDSGTTLKRLESLAENCPRLEKLWILDPRHPANALRAFSSLTSLSIDSIPPDDNWIKTLYDYLSTDGHKLAELNLRIIRYPNPPEIDLREIFLGCPNLATLTNEGSRIVWQDGQDPAPLTRLKTVQIGETVSARAIVKILSLAPELTSLHVHSCNELTDQHLEILREPNDKECLDQRSTNFTNSIVKNLTCFYLDEANKVSAVTVINMFKYCKNLRHIGNLVNWGLNRDEIRLVRDIVAKRNVDVEFCPVAHWFWNTCCRN